MTEMYCDGLSRDGYPGYNAHPGSAAYIVRVPFSEAIISPPICRTHDRPYLTVGGYRLSKVARAFQRTGEITTECRVTYGSEQAAWCHAHDWSGSASETDADDRCPHWRIAAWIVRRHEAVA